MASDFDQIVENHFKKKRNIFGFESIAQLIEEMMREETSLTETKRRSAEPGAQQRKRALRLPNVIPTEITVGQRPNSEDRAIFELWMSNLGGDIHGSDQAAVAAKLKAITDFFDHPEQNLKEDNIPEMLSYCMFLNQFVWMTREFNASVAGFLWEPFLASLFEGGVQVPTSEGDIADIKIFPDGEENPISLKILNEVGIVKGSFSDLLGHFAKGGKEMRYVVLVKDYTKKEKKMSQVVFYEFNITAANFMEWIGSWAHTETIETKEQRLVPALALQGTRDQPKLRQTSMKAKPPRIHIRHAKTGGQEGRQVYGDEPVLAKLDKETGEWMIVPETAAEINLRTKAGQEVREGPLDLEGSYVVDVAAHGPGGRGGSTLRRGYEAMPGMETKDTRQLWGGEKGFKAWMARAGELGVVKDDGTIDPDAAQQFFIEAADEATGAPGARKGSSEQFHISPTHYKNKANRIGALRVTVQAVENFFEVAAKKINDDLVRMFNKLADLTDNIGRFFLADCGGDKCTDEDAANRTNAGSAAISDSGELADAVNSSVQKMQEK